MTAIQISTARITRSPAGGLTAGLAVAAACIARYAVARRAYVRALVAEVARRGGETSIAPMPYGSAGRAKIQERELEAVSWSADQSLCLLHCEGWRYYSRRFGARPAALAYLAGRDDNGLFAVRVTGTCESVTAALTWLTPAPARKPGAVRQGNVYAVPYRGRAPVTRIGRHRLLPCTLDGQPSLRLVHEAQDGRRGHEHVLLPGQRWTLVEQRRMDTTRGRTRD